MNFDKYRKIIHIDMDAFYASVEQRDNPALRGKPIAIGRSVAERGVIATASYEARVFGVRSAMSTAKALKLCPSLILVRPDFAKYEAISFHLYNLYKKYTDLVEPIALDECYLDISGANSATIVAKEIKETIKRELHLTASAGVSINKLLAKIGSDLQKPDGLVVIPPSKIESFIKTVPVKDINGVGKRTQETIERLKLGVTCGDLQKIPLLKMIEYFGLFGERLYYFVRGIDDRPVAAEREMKSIGTENTFSCDIYDKEQIKKNCIEQFNEVYEKTREKKLKWRTITLKIKYSDFTQITRSRSVDSYSDDYQLFYESIIHLLNYAECNRGIRLTGVTISNIDSIHEQKGLFD